MKISINNSKQRCNQYFCLFEHRCKYRCRARKFIATMRNKLKLPIFINYNNLKNISGTSICPHNIRRQYDCTDCTKIYYDALGDGYCTKRKNKVVDDRGCNIRVCKFREIRNDIKSSD